MHTNAHNYRENKHKHRRRDMDCMECAKTMHIDAKLSKLVSHDSRLTLSMTYRRRGKNHYCGCSLAADGLPLEQNKLSGQAIQRKCLQLRWTHIEAAIYTLHIIAYRREAQETPGRETKLRINQTPSSCALYWQIPVKFKVQKNGDNLDRVLNFAYN